MAVSGGKKLRLGEILINANVLQPDQLEDALEKQKETREPIGEILTKLGFVTEEKIKYALELQYGVKHVNLKTTRIAPEVLKLLPEALMKQYQMIPVAVNQITVALVDPNNILATDEIRKRLRGVNVVPAVCTESDFWETLKTIPKDTPASAGESRAGSAAPGVGHLPEIAATTDAHLADLIEKAAKGGGEATLVPLVNAILALAIKKRAAAVILEPMEHESILRFRVDGHLLRTAVIPGKVGASVVSRVKIMAGLAQTGGNTPQTGTFAFAYEARQVKLSFHSMPARHGQLLSVRLFDSATVANQGLDNLVLQPRVAAALRTLLARPAGVVLFAGPHGAGKTILMYAALNELQKSHDASIITVESPIEFDLAGVTQVPVSLEPGPNDLSVLAGLRSALEQSPNVVMLGDVSEPAIAQRLVRGGLSGTLLLAGMSTTQSPLIEARESWEVPARMVANAVAGMVTQRLVRRLCPACKEKYTPEDERMVAYFARLNGTGELHRPVGCDACYKSGFAGQVGVYEVIPFTPAIRELVARSAPKGQIDQLARQAGHLTLEDYAMWLVGQGFTTWDEVKKTDILELAQAGQMAPEAAGHVPAAGQGASV